MTLGKLDEAALNADILKKLAPYVGKQLDSQTMSRIKTQVDAALVDLAAQGILLTYRIDEYNGCVTISTPNPMLDLAVEPAERPEEYPMNVDFWVAHSPYPGGIWRGIEKCSMSPTVQTPLCTKAVDYDVGPILFANRKSCQDFIDGCGMTGYLRPVRVGLLVPDVGERV